MKTTLFRLTAGLACVYHLLLGACLWLLPAESLSAVSRIFLGARIDFDAPLALAARFSSAYLLAFGLVMGLLCWHPARLRILLVPALVLFGVRILNKLIMLGSIEQTLEVNRGRSLFAVASLVLLFGLLAATAPRNVENPES